MIRGVYVEEFDGTTPFGVGENECVDYAGTQQEIGSGSYALMALGTGPRSAERKVRGAIDGSPVIKPTEPTDGPSYAGIYSERVVGWLTDPDNDTFRVAHFRLHGRLTGSDGPSVVFESTFKVTMKRRSRRGPPVQHLPLGPNRKGRVQVSRETVVRTCFLLTDATHVKSGRPEPIKST